MKKGVYSIILLGLAALLIGGVSDFLYQDPYYLIRPELKIEKIHVTSDKDGDGITDPDDILEGARKEIADKTKYRSEYYQGGFPPDDEGVCTDVIWRALKDAGYDLKTDIDEDIRENAEDYPRVNGSPDPNIDFRRVKNQHIFFKKYGLELTTEVIPYDAENLQQWQAGDIVVLERTDHIAIISDKRRKDGVPYIIHNANSRPKEQNLLMQWSEANHIIGHFRYPKYDID